MENERLHEEHLGEQYGGIVTGIAQIGLFIQLDHYLVEGLVRFDRLGDDWWEIDPDRAWAIGQRTGSKIRIGDRLTVIAARIDIAHRQLDLQVLGLLGQKPIKEGSQSQRKDRERIGKRQGNSVQRTGRRKGRRPSGGRGKKRH